MGKKKSAKAERERQVLLGLVDHYIQNGKPVGSSTLKDEQFDGLSSATLRNYFAHLEEEGFLQQLHTSGGRIPTESAYRVYIDENEAGGTLPTGVIEELDVLKGRHTTEIAAYLQECAELLSHLTHTAVFLSAPRFDQDFVIDLKLVQLDVNRCLAIIVTNFGMIRTEVLHSERKLSSFAVKRVESYFHYRLTEQDKPKSFDEEELAIAWYNEVMVRYVVGYSNFPEADITRTGFSKLLNYSDFNELSNTLALFENRHSMRLLLRDAQGHNNLRTWVGSDLKAYTETPPDCSVVATPYCINKKPVGAIGILGPLRMPYRELFSVMRALSKIVTNTVTDNLYKHQITYRQPMEPSPFLTREEFLLLEEKEHD